MILEVGGLAQLAQQCAPQVSALTLLAIARAESGLDPLAIAVNGARRRVYHPTSAAAAAGLARDLIARGENLDLGLSQINSRNLTRLGLTAATAFDPCRSLAASARLLRSDYGRARAAGLAEQEALVSALSRYNTGDERAGVRNGYVARVRQAAARLAPLLGPAGALLDPAPAIADAVRPASASPPWDVFATRPAQLVF